jgi:hypothetical protein
VAIFVPFTALTTDLDFRVHYAARMAVVDDVLAGQYGLTAGLVIVDLIVKQLSH